MRRSNKADRAKLGALIADSQAVRVSVVATVVDLYVQMRRAQCGHQLTEALPVLQRRDTALEQLLARRGMVSQ